MADNSNSPLAPSPIPGQRGPWFQDVYKKRKPDVAGDTPAEKEESKPQSYDQNKNDSQKKNDQQKLRPHAWLDSTPNNWLESK